MQNPFYLLIWTAGVAALWFLWDIGIKRLFLDLFRERVFELRFELFRLGASGDVPFNSDTYRTLETLFSGLLRFGHRVTFMTFVFSKIEQNKAKNKKEYVDVGQQIALQISRLDEELQTRLTRTLVELRKAILFYAAFTSLFFLAAFVVFTVARVFGLWKPDDAEADFSGVIETEAYRAESRRSMIAAIA